MDGVTGDPGHGRPVAKHRTEIEQRAWIAVCLVDGLVRHHGPGDGERDKRGAATERERGGVAKDRADDARNRKRTCSGDSDARRVHRDGTRLRRAFQRIGNRFQPRHVGARPANARQRPQDEGRPEAVGEKCKAKMREGRQACTEDVNPPRRQAVGQRDQHRHGGDVSGIENADQPAAFGLREVPACDVGRKQRGQCEGADLHQHLGRNDRPDEAPYSRRELRCGCHGAIARADSNSL